MSLITAYHNRTIIKDLTVLDGAGNAITPGDNDKLRVIIGRKDELESDLSGAQLVVSSDADTANGSSLTVGGGTDGRHRLRIDAADLAAINPGVYTFFFDYFDNADQFDEDSPTWKNIDRQVFALQET